MSDTGMGSDLFGEEGASRGAGDELLIVGLGASAGGIRALKEFFAQVPADSGIAYVVILHLSPHHDSMLAEVLQSTAAIPVTQVNDRVHVEPDHVYVIPPNRSLAMADGHLALSEVTRVEERRAPVDIFFRTLAESRRARAVSVVLSGTGADGSMGMKRVKEYGGVCIVQEPQEAEYSDMPRNSIATGLVDYVLPVAEIPARIIAYRDRLGSVNIPAESLDRADPDYLALRDIFTLLRTRTGHDFSNYKRSTVLRRIERRISVRELPDLPAYARYLREHEHEAPALLKDLLISVTNFFRDPDPFGALELDVIPRLFENKGPGDHVRVWAAGCATGEEAYSMAMLLSEHAGSLTDGPSVQVFATDIDEWAVSKAREGLYTSNDAADVSAERMRRFFVDEGDGYRVRQELREMVLFAEHNLIKDPPFSHIDLITCRNLLIYFNRTAQEHVMRVLHFALNPEGYLFLGTSESVEGAGDLFAAVSKENHIFQSRPVEARLPLAVPDMSLTTRFMRYQPEARTRKLRTQERLSFVDLHQRLLEQYAPPSVIVNEEYEVVHLSERAGRYMRVAGGEPSRDLLKMVRPELRLELRTALYQATQKRQNVEVRGLEVQTGGSTERVNLIVRPVLREDAATRGFVLVLFEGVREDVADAPAQPLLGPADRVARQLEEELMRVRAQIRATGEQHELQREELKASNEELQSINEELRSTAEELETGREELQSVNEELTTVNQELKIKIEEISQSNNDFQNLMNSTDIGTIFLDRGARVKLFTPRARDIFNLIPSDVGRPLSDLTGRLDYGGLLADVEQVLDRLQPVEREIATDEGRKFLTRLVPYRTAQDHINGVVLTFIDITGLKRVEEELRRAHETLERTVGERTRELSEAVTTLEKEARERQRAEAARTELVRQFINAQEKERHKIARDLHDQLGQQLTALRLQLEILKGRLVEDARAFEQAEQLQTIARRIESEIDFLAWELRPLALDDLGLAAAGGDYVRRWSKYVDIPADYHTAGFDHQRLSPEIETNLYRILQEALNNVQKHAGASRVGVILERRGHSAVLIIEEDGGGFATSPPPAAGHGMGITGMHERAAFINGTLEIESAPGQGTTLFIRVPAVFAEGGET